MIIGVFLRVGATDDETRLICDGHICESRAERDELVTGKVD